MPNRIGTATIAKFHYAVDKQDNKGYFTMDFQKNESTEPKI